MGYILFEDSNAVFLLEAINKKEINLFNNNSYPHIETSKRIFFHISFDGPGEIAEVKDVLKLDFFHESGEGSREIAKVKDVLNIEIEFEDSDQVILTALISFPRIEVERISYGIFLKKYGKGILDLFREKLGVKGTQIPPYDDGTAFPMLLKFFDFTDEGVRFNNANRDQTLLWYYENFLLLCSESDKLSLNAAVSRGDDDLIPNCVICQAPLHEQVHVDGIPNLRLPVLLGYNTTQFPCAHCFHTHCIIRAIQNGHQKCPLCRNEPDDRWWRSMYSTSYYYLSQCWLETTTQLRAARRAGDQEKAHKLHSILSEITNEYRYVSARTRSGSDVE